MIKTIKDFLHISKITNNHIDFIPYIGIWVKNGYKYKTGIIFGWFNKSIGFFKISKLRKNTWIDEHIYCKTKYFMMKRDLYIIYTPTISFAKNYCFIQIFGIYFIFGNISKILKGLP